MPRVADPDELTKETALLIYEDASFVTGSAFTADGGMTALLV